MSVMTGAQPVMRGNECCSCSRLHVEIGNRYRAEELERAAYTSALRTSSRGMTPSFSSGKASFAAANSWKTSFISFSSSAVMLFSFASLDARPRFGGAEVLAGAPRLLGGYGGGVSLRYEFRGLSDSLPSRWIIQDL